MSAAATRASRALPGGAVPCGLWYRAADREGQGPRGGRRTFSIAVCVACGRREEVVDARPGSGRAALAAARLQARPCRAPRVPPDDERVLLALAAAVRSGTDRLPLPFAVEFLGERTAARVATAAWRSCARAFALLDLYAAWDQRRPLRIGPGGRPVTFVSESSDGASVQSDLWLPDEPPRQVFVSGPQADVAAMVRGAIPSVAWLAPWLRAVDPRGAGERGSDGQAI